MYMYLDIFSVLLVPVFGGLSISDTQIFSTYCPLNNKKTLLAHHCTDVKSIPQHLDTKNLPIKSRIEIN